MYFIASSWSGWWRIDERRATRSTGGPRACRSAPLGELAAPLAAGRHHAPLVRPQAQHPAPLAHRDLEPQLASVHDLPEPRDGDALRALRRRRDVLDADLEAHCGLPLG